jgi:hypothetical protein
MLLRVSVKRGEYMPGSCRTTASVRYSLIHGQAGCVSPIGDLAGSFLRNPSTAAYP